MYGSKDPDPDPSKKFHGSATHIYRTTGHFLSRRVPVSDRKVAGYGVGEVAWAGRLSIPVSDRKVAGYGVGEVAWAGRLSIPVSDREVAGYGVGEVAWAGRLVGTGRHRVYLYLTGKLQGMVSVK